MPTDWIRLMMEWSKLDTELQHCNRQGYSRSSGGFVFSSSFQLRLSDDETTSISLLEETDPNDVQSGWIFQAVCYSAQARGCFWELNSAGACQVSSDSIKVFRSRAEQPTLALLATWVEWLRRSVQEKK
jgi:hypothetical protein